MNKIFIIGNLTHDPETRTTTSGVPVCSFSVAAQRRFASGGERQRDFFRVNAWRGLADTCQKFLAKGKKVAVIGELQARIYDDKQGKTRVSLEINADEVEFLSPKSEPHEEPKPDVNGFTDYQQSELPF